MVAISYEVGQYLGTWHIPHVIKCLTLTNFKMGMRTLLLGNEKLEEE